MKNAKLLLASLTLILCLTTPAVVAQETLPDDGSPVVPLPRLTQAAAGKPFLITAKTTIGGDASLKPQADYLRDVILPSTGLELDVRSGRRGRINLSVDSAAVPQSEGYRLEVKESGISITGHDASGVFYGIQTLLQYLPSEVLSSSFRKGLTLEVPAVSIEDAPAHPWRAMMLDAARYYYDKSFVLKFIDVMAAYKLNKLQFHFIDDCGWRLEIKKYPRLTEVGAWAGSGAERIGGYYTQDDIREIVAYAAVRGVEIIPEIEFPAHVLSAVVAYPWLGCTGLQHEVPSQHFISRDLLCVGKPSTLDFLRDVLDETVSLFPSRYVNIGGDEAVYDNWEKCPDCRALMEREGLTKASQLQGWLTNVVAGWMKERGRTVVGWEEIIMRGEVQTPVVATIWHDAADTIAAQRAGHKAILTPCTHLYFDFPESSTPGEPQHATWMPPISLEKTYTMPLADYAPASTTLGVQGCIWSDQFIHGRKLQEILPIDEDRSERYVEYFVVPRLLALAELGWTKEKSRDYTDFARRMKRQYARLDAAGVSYRVPEPVVTEETPPADGGVSLRLAAPVEGARVRYTTDGTWPTVHSAIATDEPVTAARRSDVMAITEVSPTHYSLPLYTAPDYSAYARFGTFTTDWQPLRVQLKPSQWRFECTGKISGNGSYEVSFVKTRGANGLRLKNVRVFKRGELVAEANGEMTAGEATFAFDITAFEAGTPFYIEVTASGEGGNDTSGLVFIKKTAEVAR